jgi:hypothetical protein
MELGPSSTPFSKKKKPNKAPFFVIAEFPLVPKDAKGSLATTKKNPKSFNAKGSLVVAKKEPSSFFLFQFEFLSTLREIKIKGKKGRTWA